MTQIATETCSNCGGSIGSLETPMVWDNHVVCAGCHAKLNGARQQPSVGSLNVGKLRTGLIVLAGVIVIGGYFWQQHRQHERLRQIKLEEQTKILQEQTSYINAATKSHTLWTQAEIAKANANIDTLNDVWVDPFKDKEAELQRRYDDLEQWLKENP